MNELFDILFSPKGRIGRLWYIGLSFILLTLFFVISFFLSLKLWDHWDYLTVLEYGLFIVSTLVAIVTYGSWVIIGLKRIKDQNCKNGIYVFIVLLCVFFFIKWIIGNLNIGLFFWAVLLLSMILTLILAYRKGSIGENNFGLPFRFISTQVGLKKTSRKNKKLLERIANHELYIKTSGLRGRKGCFIGVNFSGLSLKNRSFKDIDLSHAIFDGADLSKSNFNNANLTKVSFVATDLNNTIFDDCKGVKTAFFTRSNLANSNLVIDLVSETVLAQIEELAKIVKPIFLGILSACVYSWITIATIKDAAIIIDSLEVALPIIQVKVTVSAFFIATPIILYFIFLYFNLYLRRLWLEVSRLPFKLQNGREAIFMVYPWLLIGISNSNFIGVIGKQNYFKQIEIFICFLLAWWVVPFTIGSFWLNSLVKHDWWLSSFLLLLLLISIVTALIYQIDSLVLLYKKDIKEQVNWKFGVLILLLILNGELYIYDGIIGVQSARYIANIEKASLSHRQADYLIIDDKNEYKSFIGSNLSGYDLRHVNGRGVFGIQSRFVNANMENSIFANSDLTGSNFKEAILRNVDFSYASLRDVNFNRANLYYSNLEGANLEDANLEDANLEGANLEGANLKGVNWGYIGRIEDVNFNKSMLRGVNFSNAEFNRVSFNNTELSRAFFFKTKADSINFSEAQLGEAYLGESELRVANFSKAKGNLVNFKRIKINSANFRRAELKWANFEEAQLRNVNFGEAQLEGTYFGKSELREVSFFAAKVDSVSFFKAKLERANFGKTTLRGSNFTDAILDSVKVDIPTWLDSLETWNVKGAKELQGKYYVDKTKRYEERDKNKRFPYYYIKRKQIKK